MNSEMQVVIYLNSSVYVALKEKLKYVVKYLIY